MQQKYRNSIAFDERTFARLAALAEANFATPKRGGNAAALLRHLVNQAWADPKKYGLLPPAPTDAVADDE
jgi:hypothetical protein